MADFETNPFHQEPMRDNISWCVRSNADANGRIGCSGLA